MYRHPLPSYKKKKIGKSLSLICLRGAGVERVSQGSRVGSGAEGKRGSNHLSGLNGYVPEQDLLLKKYFQKLANV